jgi:hypothetical protein
VLRCWVKTATAKQAERAAANLAAHGASVPGLPTEPQMHADPTSRR